MAHQRIRDSLVAEEIAAQAGTEGTPDLFLSDLLSPVIFGPQRPPLAASGYFPGCMGINVAAVALNTSQVGIFVSGTNTDSIIRVPRITIQNQEAGALLYTIRRLDDATGFTLAGLVPGYISAGIPRTGGVFSLARNNTVGPAGVQMAQVSLEGDTTEHFDGPWILNNGGLIVTVGTVNTRIRVYMNYEQWPSIRRQPIAG